MNRVMFIGIVVVIFAGCSLKDVSKPIVQHTIDGSIKIEKSVTTYDNRFTFQFRSVPLFNRSIKSIHVDMDYFSDFVHTVSYMCRR